MHPALATANPFQDTSVSPGDYEALYRDCSGESEPSVTLASSPGENISDGTAGKADPQRARQPGEDTSRKGAGVATGPSDRFILDEQAFLDAIEPPPLFLQPGYKFARRVS